MGATQDLRKPYFPAASRGFDHVTETLDALTHIQR